MPGMGVIGTKLGSSKASALRVGWVGLRILARVRPCDPDMVGSANLGL